MEKKDYFPTVDLVDLTPSELNFAVQGFLTLEFSAFGIYNCEEFRLGQGHYATSNNWYCYLYILYVFFCFFVTAAKQNRHNKSTYYNTYVCQCKICKFLKNTKGG